MESQVAVYNSHQKAVDALEVLKRNNFEMKHVSLL